MTHVQGRANGYDVHETRPLLPPLITATTQRSYSTVLCTYITTDGRYGDEDREERFESHLAQGEVVEHGRGRGRVTGQRHDLAQLVV